MARRYVCNPKTGRVIEVDGSTYKKVSKNAAYKRRLTRSPKSSSKKKLIPCKSPRRKKKSPKRRRRRAPVKCGNHEGSTAPSSDERNHIAETCGEECFLGDNMRFAVCDTECNHSPLRISAACTRARQLASRKVKGRNKAYYNRIAQRALALKEKPPAYSDKSYSFPPVRPVWGAKDEPEFDRPPSVDPDWGDDFKHNYPPFNKTDLDLGGGGPRHENLFNLMRKREKDGTCYKGQNCPVDSNTWKNVAYSTCKNIGRPHGFGSWKGDSTMSCANF